MARSTNAAPETDEQRTRRVRNLLLVAVVSFVLSAAIAFFVVTSLSNSDSFSTAAELIDEINGGGVSCTEKEIFDTEDQGLTSGRCYTSDREVDVYVFEDAADVEPWLSNLRQHWEHDILVGENWFLTTGHAETTREIQSVVGGQIEPDGV